MELSFKFLEDFIGDKHIYIVYPPPPQKKKKKKRKKKRERNDKISHTINHKVICAPDTSFGKQYLVLFQTLLFHFIE